MSLSRNEQRRAMAADCKTSSPLGGFPDFDSLLDSQVGYNLFEKYLVEKDCNQILQLFSIIRGFKKLKASVKDQTKAAKVIHRKLTKTLAENNMYTWVREETILKALAFIRGESMCSILNVFDEIKNEIGEQLKEKFYENFLQSELYLNSRLEENFTKSDDDFAEWKPSSETMIVNVYPSSNDDMVDKTLESEKSSHRFIPKTDFAEKTLPAVPRVDDKLVLKFTEKLLKARKEKEAEEKANKTLRNLKRINADPFSRLPPQLLLNAMKDKLTDTSGNDASDQSILDEHIERVFSPDTSPIACSRSEFKSLPTNPSNNPAFGSRDEYFIDGFHNSPMPNDKFYKKTQQSEYKWSTVHNYSRYVENEQLNQDTNRPFYRNQPKAPLMQRAFGDGMSATNLNVIVEEADYNQRRQEYEGIMKALPTRMGSGVLNEKSQNNFDANKRFDKRRNIQQISRLPVKQAMRAQDVLTVGYRLSDEKVPYVKKFPGRTSMTLAQFKQEVSRKGQAYYFKKESNEFGTGHIMEEVCEDNEYLPINEGNKIYAVIDLGSRH